MKYQLPLDNELIVDNFAGGGGASCGIELALGRPVNIAINHDPEALQMHEANHPLTTHYCENVWDIDPRKVCKGRPVMLAWFSPDCKHFSKAKGGKPVEKRIRGLAWIVLRWADLVRPKVICLENVEEFTTWGPLTAEGLPCKKRKGDTFRSFVNALKHQGYAVEWRELRACDYGAPTIRKRFFLIARCDGQPIEWPEKTHGPPGSKLKPYRTAAECIDWSIPCPSIFTPGRDLAENTMRRIAKGIKKYLFDAKEPFIVGAGGAEFAAKPRSVHQPLNTITVHNRSALVVPTLIQMGYGERPGQEPRVPGLEKPLGTVVAGGGKHAVMAAHLQQMYGESVGRELDEPAPTSTAKEKSALLSAFLVKHFTGVVGADLRTPFPTVTAIPNQNQIIAAHISKLRGTSTASGADEPLHTASAGGTHHAAVTAFLIKYFGTDQDPQLTEPMHTVTTKDRFGIVTIHGEDYQIVDIGMRMLTPRELYRAQGFPESYIIDRTSTGKKLTKTAQVRMCGNSVCPPLAEAIIRANVKASTLYSTRAA